jgi:hypothetical protein
LVASILNLYYLAKFGVIIVLDWNKTWKKIEKGLYRSSVACPTTELLQNP